MTRAARNDRAAACECSRAPVKLARVAGDHADVLHVYTQRICDELSKDGEVSLSLRADAGRTPDFSARLHRNACALVGANAGSLDIARDADTNVLAVRAQPRLFLANELFVPDHVGCLLECGQIIAAVVNQ